MTSAAGFVPLVYSTQEFKFPQIVSVPETEKCSLSQMTIKELFDKNVTQNFPLVLALVQDEAKSQDVFEASTLSDYLAREIQWKWQNPSTRKKITKIDYFVSKSKVISDGFQLLRKIKMDKEPSAESYEDLWWVNNLALATETDNPYAFHSICAVIDHYIYDGDFKQVAAWKLRCLKSIESHYGKGMAILSSILLIRQCYGRGFVDFFESFLFPSFKYQQIDDLFKESELAKFISELNENFFDDTAFEMQQAIINDLFVAHFEQKKTHAAFPFASFLFNFYKTGSTKIDFLDEFAAHSQIEISSLAKAALCTYKPQCVKTYIDELTANYPGWTFGRAIKLFETLDLSKEGDYLKCFNDLLPLSNVEKNPRFFEIFAKKYISFGVTSSTWKSATNICMKALNISCFRVDAFSSFCSEIEKTEPENRLTLLERKYNQLQLYPLLSDLSDAQRNHGITKKDKSLYDKGVANGKRVNERSKLSGESYKLNELANHLLKEITPFKSTREDEKLAVEILKKGWEEGYHFPIVILGDYYIRKGTTNESQKAFESIEILRAQYPKDARLLGCSIRYHLRTAQKKEDLDNIESMLKGLEELEILPSRFLLQALFQSHPLRRATQLEWFLLASDNFKRAFENADGSHIQFLLDHLARYDKLEEKDQIECRKMIAGLLGGI